MVPVYPPAAKALRIIVGVKVSEIGEFGLIERLAAKLAQPPGEDVIVGIGDDAAVWRAGDRAIMATTDTLVEGVHFLPSVAPRDVGWKSLAVNVSDIAAMGGRPMFALVTLALPPDAGMEAVEEMYGGLLRCADAYGVEVVGGDVVSAPQVSITVALMGEAVVRTGEPLLLRRDAARPGDVIAVTGTLGGSSGGLRRLQDGASTDEPLARMHLQPRPPLETAAVAIEAGIICAIDVSDGLLQDIGHICKMSDVSAVVRSNDLPLNPDLRKAYPDDALRLAVSGGEDYELVLVGTRERIDKLEDSISVPLTSIGEVRPRADERVTLVDEDGAVLTTPDGGWDHLRE
jgi:thiamine-monophosphate kinase